MQALGFDAAQKIACEIQIGAIAVGPVKLHQRHLQFRMSSEQRALFRAEIRCQVIDESDADVEQLAIAGGAIIRDTRLQQMAQTLQFMRAVHFGESQRDFVAHVVGVQIAAGFLRSPYVINDGVERRS